MLASQLYALSQNTILHGLDSCHWCGAPCKREVIHDGPLPLPFVRSFEPTKMPSNNYICKACWLWRRKRITVFYLDGSYKDIQDPINHSWFITQQGSWALRKENYEELYGILLKPPTRFVLSLLEEKDKKQPNHLQCMICNDLEEIKADTPLYFTLDNIKHCYTIYELEEALKAGDGTGTEPGVQVILKYLGEYKIEKNQKKSSGRPRKEEDPRTKKVSSS